MKRESIARSAEKSKLISSRLDHQLQNAMAQDILILLLVFAGAFSSQQQAKTPRRAMAVTIDDLPYVNDDPEPPRWVTDLYNQR
jgi:hypothetical protein